MKYVKILLVMVLLLGFASSAITQVTGFQENTVSNRVSPQLTGMGVTNGTFSLSYNDTDGDGIPNNIYDIGVEYLFFMDVNTSESYYAYILLYIYRLNNNVTEYLSTVYGDSKYIDSNGWASLYAEYAFLASGDYLIYAMVQVYSYAGNYSYNDYLTFNVYNALQSPQYTVSTTSVGLTGVDVNNDTISDYYELEVYVTFQAAINLNGSYSLETMVYGVDNSAVMGPFFTYYYSAFSNDTILFTLYLAFPYDGGYLFDFALKINEVNVYNFSTTFYNLNRASLLLDGGYDITFDFFSNYNMDAFFMESEFTYYADTAGFSSTNFQLYFEVTIYLYDNFSDSYYYWDQYSKILPFENYWTTGSLLYNFYTTGDYHIVATLYLWTDGYTLFEIGSADVYYLVTQVGSGNVDLYSYSNLYGQQIYIEYNGYITTYLFNNVSIDYFIYRYDDATGYWSAYDVISRNIIPSGDSLNGTYYLNFYDYLYYAPADEGLYQINTTISYGSEWIGFFTDYYYILSQGAFGPVVNSTMFYYDNNMDGNYDAVEIYFDIYLGDLTYFDYALYIEVYKEEFDNVTGTYVWNYYTLFYLEGTYTGTEYVGVYFTATEEGNYWFNVTMYDRNTYSYVYGAMYNAYLVPEYSNGLIITSNWAPFDSNYDSYWDGFSLWLDFSTQQTYDLLIIVTIQKYDEGSGSYYDYDSLPYYFTATSGNSTFYMDYIFTEEGDYQLFVDVYDYYNTSQNYFSEGYYLGHVVPTQQQPQVEASLMTQDTDNDFLDDTAQIDFRFHNLNRSISVDVTVDVYLYDNATGQWLFLKQIRQSYFASDGSIFSVYYVAEREGQYRFVVNVVGDSISYGNEFYAYLFPLSSSTTTTPPPTTTSAPSSTTNPEGNTTLPGGETTSTSPTLTLPLNSWWLLVLPFFSMIAVKAIRREN